MQQLRELCVGNVDPQTRVGSIQNILGTEIERYGSAVVAMFDSNANADVISLYGCFAARKLLEAGCFALIARLDPARLLILREFQLRGRYALDERHSASLDWAVDVISEKKPGWNDAVSADKFLRSLLGGHMAEVTWAPAIERLANSASSGDLDRSVWVTEFLGQYDERRNVAGGANVDAIRSENSTLAHFQAELAVLATFRTVAKQTFSTLSKGVHLEFVVEQHTVFDVPTILASMRQALKVTSQMAFVSHFMESALSILNQERAIDLIETIERKVEGNE